MSYSVSGHDIRDVQKAEMEILLEFDRVCKLHSIPYILFTGTMLGAVRHNGFIPWDDDIDVAMAREDYRRFVTACHQDLGDGYFLQDHESDPYYRENIAKVRKDGTVFQEARYEGLPMHQGVFIDIFPLDSLHGNRLVDTLHSQSVFLISLIRASINAVKMLDRGRRGRIRGLLNRVEKSVQRAQVRYMGIFNGHRTEHLVPFGLCRHQWRRYRIRRDDLVDTVTLDFEGHGFPVPRGYDRVLRDAYGDYMELPAPEERVPKHAPVRIEL